MQTPISPDLAAQVNAFVQSGRYSDENAVLAEALQFLARRDELRAMVDEGLRDIEQGNVLDGEVVFRELRKRAAEIDRCAR